MQLYYYYNISDYQKRFHLFDKKVNLIFSNFFLGKWAISEGTILHKIVHYFNWRFFSQNSIMAADFWNLYSHILSRKNAVLCRKSQEIDFL